MKILLKSCRDFIPVCGIIKSPIERLILSESPRGETQPKDNNSTTQQPQLKPPSLKISFNSY
jgi:hypothetical protein